MTSSTDAQSMAAKRRADTESTVRVMIVGPGPKTEGGITEVIRTISRCLQGNSDISLIWISTHRSGSIPARIIEMIKGMIAALKTIRGVDVVHIHSSAQYSFIRKSVFFWIAKIWSRPIIWHLHTPNRDFVDFFGQGGLAGQYIQSVMSRCARVIVLSDSWVELAAKVLPKSRIEAIYNPIPAVSDDTDLKEREDTQRILYLAHLIQRKGYPVLIQAFADIVTQFPNSRLVFAGSGEVLEAKSLCDRLGITENVSFLGWIGEPERSTELREARIFALPSYQEGLPMGVLEAMAYSLGVITTPVGGIPDLVRHRENGLLVTPGDVGELAFALKEMLGDPSFCTKLGQAARATVQPLAPPIIARQWLKMYTEVSSSRRLTPDSG